MGPRRSDWKEKCKELEVRINDLTAAANKALEYQHTQSYKSGFEAGTTQVTSEVTVLASRSKNQWEEYCKGMEYQTAKS